MEIKQFAWEEVDSNSWLIEEGSDALLIDAVDNDALYRKLESLTRLSIVLTHSHFDHICGINRIREIKPDAIVYATRQCSSNMGNIYRNMSASANAFMSFYVGHPYEGDIQPIVCAPADVTFEGNMELCWNGHKVAMESYYGHSNDSLIAIIDDEYMFSGDTILSIPTVTRFLGGSTSRFWREDIPKLEKKQVRTVYPGHGKPGKLEDMIAINSRPRKFRQEAVERPE